MPRLETRPAPSRAMAVVSPLLALALTVACGIALFALLGKDPMRGLAMFFVEPFRGAYALSEIGVKATPLMLIGLGLAVCYRANVWNIGAEGQFVLGAIGSGGLAMRMPAEAMIPKRRMQIPPITCTGIERMSAPTCGRNDMRTAITAAPPITQTEKTRVIAMTPMFSP